ncbi:MAG: amidohydrolase family protein [bacterium]
MRIPENLLPLILGFILCTGISPSLGATAYLAADSGQVVVLNHVALVEVTTGKIKPDMALVIRGTRIELIAPALQYQPQRDAKVIDLSRHYIIPGFIEMHAHLLLHPWDVEGNIMPRYDRPATLAMLRTLLAFGITTVRDPGAPTEAALTFRDLVAREEITGPRILTAGRILNASSFDPEPFAVVTTVQQVRDEIAWQAAAGVDFIKVYSSMPPDLVQAAIAAAHTHGLRVIGHTQRTTWTEAAVMGIDALCHVAPWSPEYLPESQRTDYQQTLFGRVYWLAHLDLHAPAVEDMIAALVRHRVALDPTLIAMHSKFWGNDPRYLQHPQSELAPEVFRRGWSKGSFTAGWDTTQYQAAQAQWPKLLAFTKLLHDRGVLLTVGTDTPTPWIIPGASYHEEMQLCAEAGIPSKEVLRMATSNAAVALGRENEIGTVAPGKHADLVVLGENPLDTIQNTQKIALVIKAGKIYEPRLLLQQVH